MTEIPACPLCGSFDASAWRNSADTVSGEPFTAVRCRRCAMCFTSPRPTVASLAAYYPDDYAPHQARRPDDEGGRWLGALRGKAAERRLIPPRGQRRLLDVGCGGGTFLARMAAQGWRVTGLDFSPAAVKAVREELGLNCVLGTLPCPRLAPASFDVITLWAVLEHMPHPLPALRAARELMARGGRLYLVVPNTESWAANWFGPDWHALDLPRHVVHFTPATLRAMLSAAGFEVVGLRTVRHASWIRYSSHIARQRGRGGLWRRFVGSRLGSRVASLLAYWAGRGDGLLAEATPAAVASSVRRLTPLAVASLPG